jgi:hypothetical protein
VPPRRSASRSAGRCRQCRSVANQCCSAVYHRRGKAHARLRQRRSDSLPIAGHAHMHARRMLGGRR